MNSITEKTEMQPEYDFSNGIRGKHHKAYTESNNIVFLEPDVAEVFQDSTAVNNALRMLLDLAEQEVKKNVTRS